MNRTPIIAIFAIIGILSAAQHASSQILPQPLTLTAAPTSPAPGGQVQITARPATFETSTTFFSWSIDGIRREDASGYGSNTLTLTAGELGSSIRVTVVATNVKGATASASLTIRVASVALVWHAETYTPPWYRGKNLPVQNSAVTVTAIPRLSVGSQVLSPDDLLYKWSLDGKENVSVGVGKQTFRFIMPDTPNDEARISVTVEDMEGRLHKESVLYLKNFAPRAVVYPSSPLGGVEPRASIPSLFRPDRRKNAFDVQAEPFFFPVTSRKDLTYQWSVGNIQPQGTVQNPFLLTLETPATPNESVPAGVRIDDQYPLVPIAIKSFTLMPL